jgi:NTE family protein
LLEADEREKDIRYSSRTRLNTDANLRLQRAKVALRRLLSSLSDELANGDDARMLSEMSRANAVTVVQLIYRKPPYEGGSKDYEFSRQTMLEHWESGVADIERYVAQHPGLPPLRKDGGMFVIDPGLET